MMKINTSFVLIVVVIALVFGFGIFIPRLVESPWIIVIVALPIVNYLLQEMQRRARAKQSLNALLKEIQYNRSLVEKELRGKTSMKDSDFFDTVWYSPPPHITSYTKAEKSGVLDVLPARLYKDIIETYHYLTSISDKSFGKPYGVFLKRSPAERKLHLDALKELLKKVNSLNARLRKHLKTM
jgi:hypothetical protein